MQGALLPLLAVIVLCAAPWTRSYELDWSHKDVRVAPPGRGLPKQSPSASPTRTQFEIDLVVRHFINHETSRYVPVERVQATLYRKGRYPDTQTFWNVGGYSQMELVLSKLRPGDRYQIEIIWIDGSRRWLDETLGPRPVRRIYVDEPGPFERAR